MLVRFKIDFCFRDLSQNTNILHNVSALLFKSVHTCGVVDQIFVGYVHLYCVCVCVCVCVCGCVCARVCPRSFTAQGLGLSLICCDVPLSFQGHNYSRRCFCHGVRVCVCVCVCWRVCVCFLFFPMFVFISHLFMPSHLQMCVHGGV